MTTLPIVTTDESTTPATSCCGGSGCCGGGGGAEARTETPAETTTEPAAVEAVVGDLDVRPLLPAERHRQIFAAVAALLPGEGFVLTNDHDPKPLRYQLDAEEPGQITWEYLAEGPDAWRVRISRVAGHCC